MFKKFLIFSLMLFFMGSSFVSVVDAKTTISFDLDDYLDAVVDIKIVNNLIDEGVVNEGLGDQNEELIESGIDNNETTESDTANSDSSVESYSTDSPIEAVSTGNEESVVVDNEESISESQVDESISEPDNQTTSQLDNQLAVNDLLITEIVSDPVVGEKEWVEIYNNTSEVIDLENLQLVEGSGQKTNLQGEILAGQYLFFEKSSLNNSGDVVILQDLEGNIIDKVSYGDYEGSQGPAVNDPNSLIRESLNSSVFLETVVVTKGVENIYEFILEDEVVVEEVVDNNETVQADAVNSDSTVEDYSTDSSIEAVSADNEESIITDNDESISESQVDQTTSYDYSKLKISELLPNPEGSDTESEWVEIYNSGEESVNLKDCQLKDLSEAVFKIEEDLILESQSYIVFGRPETGIALNNSGEELFLVNPELEVIDSFSYESSEEGKSYSLIAGEMQLTSKLTPGLQNELDLVVLGSGDVVEEGEVEKNSEEVILSDESVGTSDYSSSSLKKDVVQGVVMVEPNIFGTTIFYVLADDRGYQVYFSKKDWPELKVGDEVKVSGEFSSYYEEQRLKIKNKSDIVLISEENILEPELIDSSLVDEGLEGEFVKITGQLVEKSSSKMIFTDDFKEFTVYLKQGTGLSTKIFTVGDQVEITGIVSQYKDEYRILPRYEEDLINLTNQELPVEGVVVGAVESLNSGNSSGSSSNSTVTFLAISSILLGGLSLFFFFGQYRDKARDVLGRLRFVKRIEG